MTPYVFNRFKEREALLKEAIRTGNVLHILSFIQRNLICGGSSEVLIFVSRHSGLQYLKSTETFAVDKFVDHLISGAWLIINSVMSRIPNDDVIKVV